MALSAQHAALAKISDGTEAERATSQADRLKGVASALAEATEPLADGRAAERDIAGCGKATRDLIDTLLKTGVVPKLKHMYTPPWLAALGKPAAAAKRAQVVSDTEADDADDAVMVSGPPTAKRARGPARAAAAAGVAKRRINAVVDDDDDDDEDEVEAEEEPKKAVPASSSGKQPAKAMSGKTVVSAATKRAVSAGTKPTGPAASKPVTIFKVPKSAKGSDWLQRILDHASAEDKAVASLARNAAAAKMIEALAAQARADAVHLSFDDARSANFKITALEKAARAIGQCELPLVSGEHARCLDGVGEATASAVAEFFSTGALAALRVNPLAAAAAGEAELQRIPGMTAEFAARLAQQEGVGTLAALAEAAAASELPAWLPPSLRAAAVHCASLGQPTPRDEAEALIGEASAAAAAAFTADAPAARLRAVGAAAAAAGSDSPTMAVDGAVEAVLSAPGWTFAGPPASFSLPGVPAPAPAVAAASASLLQSAALLDAAGVTAAGLLARLSQALASRGALVLAFPQESPWQLQMLVRVPAPGAAAAAAAGAAAGDFDGTVAGAVDAPVPAPASFAGLDVFGAGAEVDEYGDPISHSRRPALSHEELRHARAGAGASAPSGTGTGAAVASSAAPLSAPAGGQALARLLKVSVLPPSAVEPFLLYRSASAAYWVAVVARAEAAGYRLSPFALQKVTAVSVEPIAELGSGGASTSGGGSARRFAGSGVSSSAAARTKSDSSAAAAAFVLHDVSPPLNLADDAALLAAIGCPYAAPGSRDDAAAAALGGGAGGSEAAVGPASAPLPDHSSHATISLDGELEASPSFVPTIAPEYTPAPAQPPAAADAEASRAKWTCVSCSSVSRGASCATCSAPRPL